MSITNSGENRLTADREKKRKRLSGESSTSSTPTASTSKWKTNTEQSRYSYKLLDALRRVRSATDSAPTSSRVVRDAADRALAVAARGRSRWSRAILSSRAMKLNSARKRRPACSSRSNKTATAKANAIGAGSLQMKRKKPAIERKAKVLGRLVPGCRKLPFPTLLDEASDYIAALQMQIRAMSALSQMLAASGGAAPPS